MNSKGINSTLEYGRDLVRSGLEGARSARRNRPEAESLIGESVKSSMIPAAIGASLGLIAGYMASKHERKLTALAFGVTGALLGFGGAMVWNTRDLTGDMARGAAKNISSVRNAHWLEKNPVCYG